MKVVIQLQSHPEKGYSTYEPGRYVSQATDGTTGFSYSPRLEDAVVFESPDRALSVIQARRIFTAATFALVPVEATPAITIPGEVRRLI